MEEGIVEDEEDSVHPLCRWVLEVAIFKRFVLLNQGVVGQVTELGVTG